MTLQEILDFVNYIANKEQQGMALSPEQYNHLLKGFNVQMFSGEIKEVEVLAKQSGAPLYRLLYSASSLRPFRTFATLTTDSNGVAALPSGYVHFTGLISQYNGMFRDIDVISEEEMLNRRTSLMETPLAIKPACTMYGSSVKFYPTNVGHAPTGTVEMSYLRKPTPPNYDYCIKTSTGIVYYMTTDSSMVPVGSTHSLITPSGTVAYGVTHTGVIVGEIYTSRSVELEWDEQYHPVFIKLLLDAMGLNLDVNKLRPHTAQAK